MKKIYLIFTIITFIGFQNIGAQEKKPKKKESLDIIRIDDNEEKASIGFPKAKVEVQEENDTVAKITIGHRRYEFIESLNNDVKVRMVRIPRESFCGHYSGVQLGFCNFTGPNFASVPADGDEFMDLNSGKSMVFSLNFLQYNIGLQKHKKNLGIVTGIGWSVYNYRFDNQYKITKDAQGITVGEPIIDKDVQKSKITTSFFNVPLLLEAQIPSEYNRSKAFISAGVYGGIRVGSHIKTVYSGREKDKSRDDINLNPFQYGAMFQIGYKVLKLYATYNFSTFLENDKGPELYPFTVGLTLINF